LKSLKHFGQDEIAHYDRRIPKNRIQPVRLRRFFTIEKVNPDRCVSNSHIIHNISVFEMAFSERH
jgi:hypothetical protein